jgi:hypothetical protein
MKKNRLTRNANIAERLFAISPKNELPKNIRADIMRQINFGMATKYIRAQKLKKKNMIPVLAEFSPGIRNRF